MITTLKKLWKQALPSRERRSNRSAWAGLISGTATHEVENGEVFLYGVHISPYEQGEPL